LITRGSYYSSLKFWSLEKMPTVKTPDPIDAFVGNRVRTRRLHIGMRQDALAKKIGLTFQQIQKYEKGANRIGASRLQKISKILGVTVSFLFEGAPISASRGASTPGLPKEVLEITRSAQGRRLVEAVGRISNNTRNELARLIEIITDEPAPKRAYRKKTLG
jgi:transcriptional regulator with XRE-family HTH domain